MFLYRIHRNFRIREKEFAECFDIETIYLYDDRVKTENPIEFAQKGFLFVTCKTRACSVITWNTSVLEFHDVTNT